MRGFKAWLLAPAVGLLVTILAIAIGLARSTDSGISKKVLEAILEHDYQQARSLLAPAVEAGREDARKLSGLLCVHYLTAQCRPQEAAALLVDTAEKGDPEAQYALALALIKQRPQQTDAALSWLEKAADGGHVVSLFILGKAGVAGDNPQAVKTGVKRLKEAADAGFAPAQFILAGAYESARGVERNPEKAVKWYRHAAESGHYMAQAHLAMMYELGQGVPANGKEALRWYLSAAESGLTFAQYGLGMLLMKGELVERDYYEGIHWLEKAAEAGHAGAQDALGRAYRDGVGVARSPEKALEWFIRSGEQGHVIAQHHAGLLFATNFYVRNDKAAADWFERAAKAGYGYSQIKIGDAYRFGEGRQKSLSLAQSWYGLATKNEDQEVAALARRRMHSAAADSLEVGLAMFGVGKSFPSAGEVFDAVIAGGIFEHVLYPNAAAPIDPDVQRAYDESERANREMIQRNTDMAITIMSNL